MTKKLRSFRSKSRFISLTGVLLFASVGAYLLFGARAESSSPVVFLIDSATYNETHPGGQVFSTPILMNGTVNSSQTARQVFLNISYDSTRVKYVKSVCTDAVYCSPSSWQTQSTYSYNNSRTVCMDMKPGQYNSIHALSVHFTALGPGSVRADPNFISLHFGTAPGSCADNPSASGGQYGGNHGGCDPAGVAGAYCNGPADVGTNVVENQGVNPNQKSDSPTTSPLNGGTGSTAKKQSNQTNTVPSTSTQGANEQTEIEPSPFFDGKEFQPGSDSATLESTINSTGKKIVKLWPLLLGVVLLGGLTGYGVWKWRKG